MKRHRRVYRLGRLNLPWYAIPGSALRAIVDEGGATLLAEGAYTDTVLLIAQPDAEELARDDSAVTLTRLWRTLFQAHVERAIAASIASGRLDGPALRARFEALGRAEFAEARTVLHQDGLLPPRSDDGAVYAVFAAVFLDLVHFDPAARAYRFPAIENPMVVENLLAQDVDARRVFEATMLPGAAETCRRLVEHAIPGGPPGAAETDLTSTSESHRLDGKRRQRVAAQARLASEQGNSVRAAILWTRLADHAGPTAHGIERAAARAAVRQLAVRLRKALFVEKGEASLWVEALLPLLRPASREYWSAERRLLHDLQNVCVDHEREIFRLEPIGWLLSLGRRPLRHPLPHLREVTMCRHLRSAARRASSLRLSGRERERLQHRLEPAVRRADEALRTRFRPWVDTALEAHWVRPENLPERIAYGKLVEEMLDPIVARGFTTLGDLRDAASRSNLKMRDLQSARELVRGDALLQADRALGQVLAGVHRRGEVYLRALQRFSSLAFGTSLGRAFTRYLALPYGGAFVLLKGLEEINEVGLAPFTGAHAHLASMSNVLLVGTVAVGIINYRRFRDSLLGVLRALARFTRTHVLDRIARLLAHPLLRRLLESRWTWLAWRWLIEPALVAAPAAGLAGVLGHGASASWWVGLAVFALAASVLNTRAGRRIREEAVDGMVSLTHSFFMVLAPALFRLVMSTFDRAREWVEKLLYAGDEWLRFREGQSRAMLAVKAVLGVVWGVAAYAVRIYMNLLIEPQVNPIKHFPVVTVAAKIMLPFVLTLNRAFFAVLAPCLGSFLGHACAAITVFFLPGIFGFLVWELRSNWRLYAATRPGKLEPIIVGSHGETVVRLLRPGIHSGTLPRLFARLRKYLRGGREDAALKRIEALHHVEESVRRLLERDLVALLHESRRPSPGIPEPGSIHLATNRIRFELPSQTLSGPSLWIDLEEDHGQLTASVARPGWLERIGTDQRDTLLDALSGLFKLAGVQVVRQLPQSSGEPASVDFSKVEIPWTSWLKAWEDTAESVLTPTAAPAPPDWRLEWIAEGAGARREAD